MNQLQVTTNPDFSGIQHETLNALNDRAKDICNEASSAGMFTTSQLNSRAFSNIRLSAKNWLKDVNARLKTFTPSEALEAITYYDIIHRIAYCTPAEQDTINKYILQAFEAYIHGDKSIDQYELFYYISAGLKRRDQAYFDRPLQWHSICLEHWHKQFRYGSSRLKMSDYDTLRIVSALLDSNLWAFETSNELRYKQLLFDSHRHYLDNLPDDNTSSMDATTLKALDHFLSTSRPYLTPTEYLTYKNRLSKVIG